MAMDERRARDVVSEVLRRIDAQIDLDRADGATRLRDALDLDSIDFLNLVDQLHGATGVDIPESDYAEVDTLDGLIRYLVARAGSG